jgi:hypothetical protein
MGGGQRGRSGPFPSLSYTESLASPATSVSISSCHPGASGGGANGNNGGNAPGGSSLRSRSRSSIRDHREATSGLGGRSRSAVRRGSFTAADVDRILSPATEGGPTTSSIANVNGNGGTSRSNSAAPHRRAASIIIPSAGSGGGSSGSLGFHSAAGSSLPAFSSTAQQQNSAAAAAPWVYSPPENKGELPLVRENDSGDEGLVEMNRVDDPKK